MDGDIFKGYGIEVKLRTSDDFLKVKETLTRIGVASNKNKRLYPSCHILHKKGRYAIMHFKELFCLDGKPSDFSESDRARRNTIANLLHEWELVLINDPESSKNPVAPLSQIKVLPFAEKDQWEIVPKYNIGTKSKNSYKVK